MLLFQDITLVRGEFMNAVCFLITLHTQTCPLSMDTTLAAGLYISEVANLPGFGGTSSPPPQPG